MYPGAGPVKPRRRPAMALYIIECSSGCEWLVESDSEDEAMADWPTDAEEAIGVRPVDGRAEALQLVELGWSDVSEQDVDDYVWDDEDDDEDEDEDDPSSRRGVP